MTAVDYQTALNRWGRKHVHNITGIPVDWMHGDVTLTITVSDGSYHPEDTYEPATASVNLNVPLGNERWYGSDEWCEAWFHWNFDFAKVLGGILAEAQE